MEAGEGPPLLCLHGLGGTKASFLPTLSALAERNRVIAVDLPGFGDSDKPLTAAYDAPYFADAVVAMLDALELDRADLVGNSMGGRIAIEAGLLHPDRVGRLVLLSPAVAWLRDRNMKWLLQLPLPRLGLLQPTPRALGRADRPPDRARRQQRLDRRRRRRVPARLPDPVRALRVLRAARNIYLDEPLGEDGFWRRLEELAPRSMFVWGRHDNLVPIAFMRHVERPCPRRSTSSSTAATSRSSRPRARRTPPCALPRQRPLTRRRAERTSP